MDRYNDSFLLKCGVALSAMFMCITIYICSDFDMNIHDIFKFNRQNTATADAKINIENSVLAEEIEVNMEGRLVIKLPRGVSEHNTAIIKDLLNKKIYISFPKGFNEYDSSSIINNTDVIANTNLSVTENMANITLSLNSLKDCDICFDNGLLFMDFFVPSESGKPIVVIDAGHGGDDVGAIEKGIYEKNIDLQICNKLKDQLDREDFLVYYTRFDDSYPSVEERVNFANEIKCDLFISVHSNYFDNRSIHGTSVLYNVKDKNTHGSEWLSNIMCSEVSKASGTYNKGTVVGNDIHIVRHSNAPVALVEVGFISNDYDFQILTTDKGQENIARGIYNGIIRALTEIGKY